MIKCDKTKYPDGINYCIWKPFKDIDGNDLMENSGLCFDIPEEDIDDVIKTLQEFRNKEPIVYIESDEEKKASEYRKKRDELEKLWYYKLKDRLENISIQFSPFEWRFAIYLGTRHRLGCLFGVSKKSTIKDSYGYSMQHGFALGPIMVTW